MRNLYTLLFILISLTTIGQEINHKVIEHLGDQQAKDLFNSNRDKYDHLVDFIENSWYLQDVSFKDLSDVKDIRSLNFIGSGVNRFDDGTNFHIEFFNPLLYDIKIENSYPTKYKLGNTGKIIVFYSRTYFLNKNNAK